MMKKCSFLITFAIAASTFTGTSHLAYADDDGILPPIVFFILDTSGSMNQIFDSNTNNTRLTNAQAEIIGGSNFADASGKIYRAACGTAGPTAADGSEYDTCMSEGNNNCFGLSSADTRKYCDGFEIPIPVLQKDKSWKVEQKKLPINSKIARPKFNPVDNIDSSYYSNGVIQNYKKYVKFGFAGFAVGKTGSVVGKDSPIKQAAITAGGNTNGILRFTLIWGDNIEGTSQNTSDLDSHVYIKGQSWSGNDHIWYSSYGKCSMIGQCETYYNHTVNKTMNKGPDGVLDVDNTDPYGYRGSWSVQMTPGGPWVGVENVIWENSKNMTVNETFNFKVHNFRIAETTNGFKVEVAFRNEHGCITAKTIHYNKKITLSEDNDTYNVVTVKYLGNDNFTIVGYGSEITPDMISGEENSNSPDNIYGYSTFKVGDVTFGRDLRSQKYKKSKDCSFDMGIWDANTKVENNAAPLVYPTSSDDEIEIIESNNRLINVLRTYRAGSATPIGEALADIYFMFGGDSQDKIDEGLYKSYISNNSLYIDEKFACDSRKKSVILISDGDPNGSGLSGTDDDDANLHGHSKKIWHDAYHLYTKGMKVYVIGYSNEFAGEKANPTIADSAAQKLNLTAWKGGTCRDDSGNIIDPDDKEAYDNFVAGYKTHKTTCFYNAVSKNQLRIAIVDALREVTGGTVSKTPVVTTTATAFKQANGDKLDKDFANGFYNIYSGFQTKLGNQRDSFLYRSEFECNTSTGEFAHKSSLDIAGRFNDMIAKCRTGTPSGMTTSTTSSSTSNNCLDVRAIFTGDYSKERNAIYPGNAKLDGSDIAPEDGGYIKAGFIKNGAMITNSVGEAVSKKDYHIFERNPNNDTCDRNSLSSQYIVSPYECYSELECGVDSTGEQMVCDKGRCMSNSDYTKITNKSLCTSHSACGEHQVCHHGECVAGTLLSCDIRQYIASQELGLIEYAAPVVVPPPSHSYKEGNYMKFKSTYWNRDTMLLVAANDGMLHNFLLAKNSGSQYTSKAEHYGMSETIRPKAASIKKVEGDELWGFIPKSILGKTRDLTDADDLQSNVNAAPAVADVRLPSDAQYLKDFPLYAYTDDTTASGTQLSWRTVAVGGFRDGGRGYYALDITEPGSPKVLWEIDPLWQSAKDDVQLPSDILQPDTKIDDARFKENFKLEKDDNTSGNYYPFLLLGKTYARPIITKVLIDNVPTPVAILSGGLSDSSDSNNHIGKALYIVRLFPNKPEDLLVKTFYFENEITGAPEVYPNTFNSTAQHIYVGDRNGALYRLQVKGGDVSKWGSQNVKESKIASGLNYELPVFSPEFIQNMGNKAYEQITYKPAVALYKMDNASNHAVIQIAIATGSNDNLDNIASTASNYAAVFYDTPLGNSGRYSFNKQGTAYRPKVIAFNPTNDVKESVNYEFDNPNIEPPKDGEIALDKYQGIDLYLTDPSPHAASDTKLPIHQKVSGPAIIYNYDAFFPAYQSKLDSQSSGSDKCKAGQALIYKFAANADVRYKSLDSDVMQNHANTSDVEKFAKNQKAYLELGVGTKVYGLQVTNQLFCAGDNGKFSAPQLVAQTGAKPQISGADKDKSKLVDSDTGGLQTFTMNLDSIKAESKKMKWATVYE